MKKRMFFAVLAATSLLFSTTVSAEVITLGNLDKGRVTTDVDFTLDGQAGSEYNGKIYYAGTTAYDTEFLLNAPEKKGFDFNYWTVRRGTQLFTIDNEFIEADDITDVEKTKILATKFQALAEKNGSVSFEANWTPHHYKLSFNGNGAPYGTMDDQNFTYGEAQRLRLNEYRKFYVITYVYNGATGGNDIATAESESTFNGWSETPNGPVVYTNGNEYKNITDEDGKSITLYANWTDKNITLPTPEKEGHIFSGWYKDPTFTNPIGGGGIEIKHTYTGPIYAKWTVNPYSVIFDAQGHGTAPAPRIINYGEKIQKPEDLSCDGYVFGGWYTDPECENEYDFDDPISHQITLYAKWTQIPYTITYTLDGGTATNPSTYTVDTETFTLNNPVKDGNTFTGWMGTDIENKKNTVTIRKGSIGNREYSATWDVNTYRVYFNGNGANGGSASPQSFEYGETKNLELNNYERKYKVTYSYKGADGGERPEDSLAIATFNGWAKTADGEKVYDDGQMVRNLTSVSGEDVTLYANWTLDSVTLPVPERTGFAFGGWYEDDTYETKASETTSYTPTSNCTLYAKWIANGYSVGFNGNGNTNDIEMADEVFEYNTEQELSDNLFERNYVVTYQYNGSDGGVRPENDTAVSEFDGWTKTQGSAIATYRNKERVKNLIYTQGGKVDLYAVWSAGSVTLPSPTRTGYELEGWYLDDTKVGVGGSTYEPEGDTILKAKWTPGTYNVIFNGNGATDGSMPKQTFTYDDERVQLNRNQYSRIYTITLDYNDNNVTPNETRTHEWRFVDWRTDRDGTSTTSYSDEQSVRNLIPSGNYILYANWAKGSAISMPQPSRVGYSFGGWFDSALKKCIVEPGDSYTPYSNITLKAKWIPNRYTITYKGNKATSGVMEPQTFEYDEEKAIKTNTYVREYTVTYDYNGAAAGMPYINKTVTAVFNGWAETETGDVVYNAGDPVKNLLTSGNKDLYAKWTLGTTTLPTPTKDGHTFDGWYKEEGLINKVGNGGETFQPTSDIMLHAKWLVNTYTVSFDNKGHGSKPADQTVLYAMTATRPANPTEDGYAFEGWYEDELYATPYNFGKPVKGDLTLYAKWRYDVYRIIFSSNSGSGSVPATIVLNSSTDKKEFGQAVPTKAGNTFFGWSASQTFSDKRIASSDALGGAEAPDGTYAELSYAWNITEYLEKTGGRLDADNNLYLYAQWKDARYTLRFDANGGTGPVPADGIFDTDQSTSDIQNVHPVKDGCLFYGWAATKSWSQDRIAADGDSGLRTAPDGSFAIGTSEGWTIDMYRSYTNGSYDNRTLTLYAQFSAETKTVEFNVKGHGTAPDTQYVAPGAKATEPTPAPVAAGWTFGGWYEDEAFTKKWNFNNSVVKDMTLYAQWTAN